MAFKVLRAHQATFTTPERKTAGFVHPDDLRNAFALAMSQMYKQEVPLYGDLIRIVQGVNRTAHPESLNSDSLDRLTLERHGAIRLGKPSELHTVRRIFAVLDMQPVGYYDLSAAGLPMHATCFRPTDVQSLARNPFRVFTTLLRPELIHSEEAQRLALSMLSKRSIFSQELMQMLITAEKQGGLHADQAEVFIREALKTFSWAPVAAATSDEYQLLKAQHPILADISCFQTAHINHLTPRTLDITLAQEAMRREGMAVKDRIEGPPARRWPILLRQTSFLALEEPIQFKSAHGDSTQMIDGSHKARFGEIEERGAAVTAAGRKLYDELLDKAMGIARGQSPDEAENTIKSVFEAYPDEWNELRTLGLVYCRYSCTNKQLPANFTLKDVNKEEVLDQLIKEGFIIAEPITYEDFLPFSAAGIFQSNIGQRSAQSDALSTITAMPDQEAMEAALETCIIDSDQLYAEMQQNSLDACLRKLRL
ncbi:DUF1338 domain protein [Sarocladium implicatum]|nr:DUF1338 domain protein [Sarocladium implicatum]